MKVKNDPIMKPVLKAAKLENCVQLLILQLIEVLLMTFSNGINYLRKKALKSLFCKAPDSVTRNKNCCVYRNDPKFSDR